MLTKLSSLHWKKKLAFPVATSVQDFCRIHSFQMPCSSPPTILHQTHHVTLYISYTTGLVMCTCTRPCPFLMWSSSDPVVLHTIWSLSFPAHQYLSCTCTCPYPPPDVILARPCSLPCHMILVISCTSGLVMCTCTRPYPSPDVILARPCSLPCRMILVISCTSRLVVYTCTCPYPLLMWSLPGPVVLHAWKTSLTCKLQGYDKLYS